MVHQVLKLDGLTIKREIIMDQLKLFQTFFLGGNRLRHPQSLDGQLFLERCGHKTDIFFWCNKEFLNKRDKHLV